MDSTVIRSGRHFSWKPANAGFVSFLLVLMALTGPPAFGMPGGPIGNRASAHTSSVNPVQLGGNATASVDPRSRLDQIAERMRAAIARARNQRPLARPAHVTAVRGNVDLQNLRRRLGGRLKLMSLHGSGIPRQIKGGPLEYPASSTGTKVSRDQDTARHFFKRQRKLMQLDDPDQELELSRYTEDELGRRHLRYSQRYRGVPVWPSEVIVHVDAAGNVDAMEGGHKASPRTPAAVPAIDAAMAAQFARRAVNAAADATRLTPQLIYHAGESGETRLAWKVELPLGIRENWLVVVDADNGAILDSFNRVTDANVAGSGTDLLGSTVGLNVWQGGSSFYLVDTSKPMFDSASAPPDAARGAIVVKDARNLPAGANPDAQPNPVLHQITAGSPDGSWLKDGVSAAFNLAQTYDYYLERHQRDSIDGNQGSLFAIVRFGANYFNAFWSNPYMVFGTGDRFAAALDVVAHELTHGVTEHSANLLYRGQSGALNEAMSDIFGEAVEARTRGHNDWLMGTDLGFRVRNLKTPGLLGDPATMSQYQALPITAQGDWGGVHTNSCIVGHAFYLLAEGLSGAIGLNDAERIFYRALTLHLLPNAQFADMRAAAVLSAEELFGTGSAQALRTGQAFDAVEINDPGATPPATTPVPVVDAEDSTLCVYFDNFSGLNLCRRETAMHDPEQGQLIGDRPVAFARPAVSGDGTMAAFIDANHDLCFLLTDDSSSSSCTGFPGSYDTVAMSPDGARVAVILLDGSGQPLNSIMVIDINAQNASREYELKAPATEGAPATIDYADAMDFSFDGKLLYYDAKSHYPSGDGTPTSSWSIYALDLIEGQFLNVVPPIQGLDVGNPSVGRAGQGHLTYERLDPISNDSTLWVADLVASIHSQVGAVAGTMAVPHFTGDDKAIVFAQLDSSTSTGTSLLRLPLAGDLQAASGPAQFWMSDAFFGVIYRRGAFTGPKTFGIELRKRGQGQIVSSPSGIDCGPSCTASFPQDTSVTLVATASAGWQFQQWTGCDAAAGSTCTLTMSADKRPSALFLNESDPVVVVETQGKGMVRAAAGIRCGTRCIGTHLRSDRLTLQAFPAKGWVIEGWDGCESSAGTSCFVQVDSLKRVRARFRLMVDRLLTITVQGSGTVTSRPSGIVCGADCSESYGEGTATRLIAVPASPSRFGGWLNCPQARGNRCLATMDADRTIGAVFDAAP
jgi:Zn-dependent metalloprotease